MYDKLVKWLKNCATQAAPCLTCDMTDDGSCIETLMKQAADAIEDLISALTASNEVITKNKPHWIPVTERLPKYGERVLVFGGFTMYVAYYDKNQYGYESWHKLNSKSHYCNPTHWMPLPEPPKEET